jgi:CTP-dependent riboflavin kinase
MMGKVDLAASILEFALIEISLRSLQEKLHLSSKVLDGELKMLKEKDLVDISPDGRIVSATKRGTQFLDLYKSIHAKYLSVHA